MKYSILGTVMILFFLGLFVMIGGMNNQAATVQEYKRALDAAADAAAKHTTYVNESNLSGLSYGYGEGLENSNAIQVDRGEALTWFYHTLFRCLQIEDIPQAQDKLKRYIPMKCLVTFNNLSIADCNDNWIVEKDFVMEYGGREYLFTLSDQVMDMETKVWSRDADIGLDTKVRQEMVAAFIQEEIDHFLAERENGESGIQYSFRLGLNENSEMLRSVNGSNFIVLCEGLPIPGYNFFTPQKQYYAFSLGGSEIVREK